jgi:hypothetical protein
VWLDAPVDLVFVGRENGRAARTKFNLDDVNRRAILTRQGV